MIRHLLLLPFACLPACMTTGLPTEPPPLVDMEEPIALKTEPDDEPRRRTLATGSFSGLYGEPAWFEEPDEPGQAPDALRIDRIVENSPAVAAGLQKGDLLLGASAAGRARVELRWPAQWRKLETDLPPGAVVTLEFDRAGTGRSAKLTLVARLGPPPRSAAETFRETRRAGIVVRTATEVEARATGLGAGAGAVLIGMAASSPWRKAGLVFGDLIVAVDGEPVHHPQALLGRLRTAAAETPLEIEFVRAGKRHKRAIPTTRRATGVSEFSIPLLFSYESSRDRTSTSLLFGFLAYETTAAAWSFDFLWFTWIRGGERDVLDEVDVEVRR